MGHRGDCETEAKDDGYSSCTCGYASLRYKRLAASERLYAELKRQGPNTIIITDVEADYLAKLLAAEYIAPK